MAESIIKSEEKMHRQMVFSDGRFIGDLYRVGNCVNYVFSNNSTVYPLTDATSQSLRTMPEEYRPSHDVWAVIQGLDSHSSPYNLLIKIESTGNTTLLRAGAPADDYDHLRGTISYVVGI